LSDLIQVNMGNKLMFNLVTIKPSSAWAFPPAGVGLISSKSVQIWRYFGATFQFDVDSWQQVTSKWYVFAPFKRFPARKKGGVGLP